MDFTMFIGIILATALMIYGMGIPNLGNFFDVQSIVIVLIGTLATLFSGYGIKAFKQVPKHIKLIMAKDKFNAPRQSHENLFLLTVCLCLFKN